MWLGECGYVPGVDELLREAAIRYFVVDSHAVLHADTPPVHGVYAPVFCPTGVAAFARDTESSEQVWSARHGYPGDPHYRDFYRGHRVRPSGGVHRGPTYTRRGTACPRASSTTPSLMTSSTTSGSTIRTSLAVRPVCTHLTFEAAWSSRSSDWPWDMDRPPVIVSPYDAELFGHWWYEGPVFLGDVYRQLHHDQNVVEPITPGDYLERHPTNQQATPSPSSWGLKGFNEQWLNESNAWTWPHVHIAGERMTALAHRHATAEDELTRRALNQAARELMLAQSSDWPFIMATGTTVPYANRRFNEHIAQFNRLYEQLVAGEVSETVVTDLEARNNIFPDLDYRIYAT